MNARDASIAIDACTDDLRETLPNYRIKARIGSELFDKLHERDVCLDSAISPDDPQAPLYTWARLSCGCSWQCDYFRYGRAVNARWTVVCEEHKDL